jgi:hypothetical protein
VVIPSAQAASRIVVGLFALARSLVPSTSRDIWNGQHLSPGGRRQPGRATNWETDQHRTVFAYPVSEATLDRVNRGTRVEASITTGLKVDEICHRTPFIVYTAKSGAELHHGRPTPVFASTGAGLHTCTSCREEADASMASRTSTKCAA